MQRNRTQMRSIKTKFKETESMEKHLQFTRRTFPRIYDKESDEAEREKALELDLHCTEGAETKRR